MVLNKWIKEGKFCTLEDFTITPKNCMDDIFHEIVKYAPSGYNKDGIYTSDDWTSISDIGKSFNGKILSVKDYLKVEEQYVKTVLMIMSALDCEYLAIEYIEINQDKMANDIEIYRKKYGVSITGTLPKLKKGTRLSRINAPNVLRLCLRELCYIVFSCKSKELELYFSYDYYLNVKCPIDRNTLSQIVKKNNLYLDPRG